MSKDVTPLTFHITFRNTDGTEALKSHAETKITTCLNKFVHKETSVHVVLSVEKNRHIAEISFNTLGNDFITKEETTDLYASIDAACHSLAGQLRKHKDKITSHHK